jgi:hypothetical protein
MKSINDINPERFGCFYYSPLSGEEISLSLISPDGDIPYSDYEAFSTEDGTVIAFNVFNEQNTDYAYRLRCGELQETIQFQLYENLESIFNNSDYEENSFYALFGSKSVLLRVENGEHLFVPLEEHCDKYIYGPAPFFELNDGVSQTLLDFSTFNSDNIKGIFPVLAVQGEACILRVRMNEEDGSYRNYPAVTAIAKTFLGIMRMACEWRALTAEPFNVAEFPALKISEFLNLLGINEEVDTAIRSAIGPMHVEKFLTDTENAREVIEENGTFPEELKTVLTPQLRYRTLKTLSANTGFNADESVLLKEQDSVNSSIYAFMVYNNIDSSQFSSVDEIIEYLKTNTTNNLSTNQLSINDYLKKAKTL